MYIKGLRVKTVMRNNITRKLILNLLFAYIALLIALRDVSTVHYIPYSPSNRLDRQVSRNTQMDIKSLANKKIAYERDVETRENV